MATKRIDGLDAWRAVFLLMGICFHSIDLQRDPNQIIIYTVSSMFRMGAFMAIAGVLSGMVLQNRDPYAWMKRRIFQLGVPFLMMSIVTNVAIYNVTHKIALYHMWFLLALVFYTVLLYLCKPRIDKLLGNIDTWLRTHKGNLVVILSSIMAVNVIGMYVVKVLLVKMSNPTANIIIEPAASFLIPFIFGYAYARCPSLQELLNGSNRILLGMIVILLLPITLFVSKYGIADLQNHEHHQFTLLIMLNHTIVFPIICLVLHHAHRVKRIPNVLTKLSAASYTIYLVHYLFCALLIAYLPHTASPTFDLLVVMTCAFILSYGCHLLVQRSTTLQYFVNGKEPGADQVGKRSLSFGYRSK